MGSRRPQEGFTLNEVLISLGILGIIMALSAQFLPSIDASRHRIEALGTRDALALRVRRAIDKNNVLFSAKAFKGPGNTQLLHCVDEQPTPCQATQAKNPVGIQLGYPRGTGGQAEPITGSDQQPLRFDHMGGICTIKGLCRAEFEVRSSFYAICPGGQASCPNALSLRVRYQVRNISLGSQRTLPPVPPDAVYADPVKGAVSVLISEKKFVGSCPPFSFLTSIDVAGRLQCKCQPGSRQTGTVKGQPVCTPEAITCPNNQTHRLIGYSATMEPICIKRELSVCRAIATNELCQGVLQSVELGTCRVVEKPGGYRKGGAPPAGEIVCERNQNLCCTSS